ncbi:hypothetical protein GDI3415 [Gluconacetobacter diazotrophicus PA1 5]|uniref:Winged helix-turn helix domain-containing protein n=1 Tax=Gluconacetobacter diazotrophicus (strain ATCC 49037 / DSM 5601 / CCUG 37298 / CIP 103539 / LMG 7603 / PAl5) TaxID=272568 RepID=A9H3T7_GLUDA|nr:hypothetical protein GDI3415 [Gluconacetobacter diazotrophicus PA1 5]
MREPACRLNAAQQVELKALVEAGPDRQRDGVVRWRRVDLQRVIEERFGVVYHERHVTARIAEVQVETRRHQATVALIRALGGGWSRAQLLDTKAIRPFGLLQYEGLHVPKEAGGVAVGTSPDLLNLTGPDLRGPGLQGAGLTEPLK